MASPHQVRGRSFICHLQPVCITRVKESLGDSVMTRMCQSRTWEKGSPSPLTNACIFFCRRGHANPKFRNSTGSLHSNSVDDQGRPEVKTVPPSPNRLLCFSSLSPLSTVTVALCTTIIAHNHTYHWLSVSVQNYRPNYKASSITCGTRIG